MPSASGRQYLDAPPHDGDGSDDAGSRESALQDMDLHGFHPDIFATPRGSYVIPGYLGNVTRCQSNNPRRPRGNRAGISA